MRSKKAIRNIAITMVYQVVTVICGLIVPRLILETFGSSYNGVTSSIRQFLTYVALLKGGVEGVTRAALYKPLAEHDTVAISGIFNATEHFMHRIAWCFLGFIIAFAGVYPFLVSGEFDWVFTATLVLIMGISTFAQYYFGLAYRLLLEADQRQYVISVIQIVSTVLNTMFAALLIALGGGIHIVKLGSAIAFSLNPLLLNAYVRRKCIIDKRVQPNMRALSQRWDAMGQSIALFIHDNTDVILLTIFTNMKEVSVYSVYNFIIVNIRQVLMTFITGFGAAFGNMLARGERRLMEENLKIYELIVFGLTTVLYATMGTMILPFVIIYTHGVNDVEYVRPLFAILSTMAGAFGCFRIPYQSIVEAAGHFRQTRNGAFLEAGLNIAISILAVRRLGLAGVAVGTVAATIFRSIQYSWYLSRHVIPRSQWFFWRHILVSLCAGGMIFLLGQEVYNFATPNFLLWSVKSILVLLTAIVLVLVLYLIFFRRDLQNLTRKLIAAFRKGGRFQLDQQMDVPNAQGTTSNLSESDASGSQEMYGTIGPRDDS